MLLVTIPRHEDRAVQRLWRIGPTGFWLVTFLSTMSDDERAALYADLGARVASKAIQITIAAVYGIDDIKTALEHAAREARGGKVLVTPNGPRI